MRTKIKRVVIQAIFLSPTLPFGTRTCFVTDHVAILLSLRKLFSNGSKAIGIGPKTMRDKLLDLQATNFKAELGSDLQIRDEIYCFTLIPLLQLVTMLLQPLQVPLIARGDLEHQTTDEQNILDRDSRRFRHVIADGAGQQSFCQADPITQTPDNAVRHGSPAQGPD